MSHQQQLEGRQDPAGQPPQPPTNRQRQGRRQSSPQPRHGRGRGFTLIELLVVMVVLAVLATLLLPCLQRAKAAAWMTCCISNMRQVGLAMMLYSSDNKGIVPGWGWSFHEPNYGQGPERVWHAGERQGDLTTGLVWPYTGSADIYRCPGGTRDPERADGSRRWGFPPVWHYALNGQAAVSHGSPSQYWDLNPAKMHVDPSQVMMLFEQSDDTAVAQDNGIVLFRFPYSFGDDALGFSNHLGKGCLSFFDGHVTTFSELQYLTQIGTLTGTKTLYGGCDGFYW